MNGVTNIKDAAKRNFDPKIAFSTAAGVAILGAAAFLLHKTNIKPLKQAANVATLKKAK